MIKQIIKEHPDVTERSKAREIIKDYINKTCVAILENTAVFKKDEMGMLAFRRFLSKLDIK